MSEQEDTKHTPGPWAKYEASSMFKDELWEDCWYCGVKSVKTNRTICQMTGKDTEDEERANATLIAQAPAMRELIRNLRTFLQGIIGEARHETEYGPVIRITAEDVTNDSMVAMAKDLAARTQMMHWERQCGLMLDATRESNNTEERK